MPEKICQNKISKLKYMIMKMLDKIGHKISNGNIFDIIIMAVGILWYFFGEYIQDDSPLTVGILLISAYITYFIGTLLKKIPLTIRFAESMPTIRRQHDPKEFGYDSYYYVYILPPANSFFATLALILSVLLPCYLATFYFMHYQFNIKPEWLGTIIFILGILVLLTCAIILLILMDGDRFFRYKPEEDKLKRLKKNIWNKWYFELLGNILLFYATFILFSQIDILSFMFGEQFMHKFIHGHIILKIIFMPLLIFFFFLIYLPMRFIFFLEEKDPIILLVTLFLAIFPYALTILFP